MFVIKITIITLFLLYLLTYEQHHAPLHLKPLYQIINWKNSIIVLCNNTIPDFKNDFCYQIYIKEENYESEKQRLKELPVKLVKTKIFDYLYEDKFLIKKHNLIIPIKFLK